MDLTNRTAVFSYSGNNLTAELNMNGNKIKGVAEPDDATDATNKTYVDNRVVDGSGIQLTDDLAFKSLNLNGATLGSNVLAVDGNVDITETTFLNNLLPRNPTNNTVRYISTRGDDTRKHHFLRFRRGGGVAGDAGVCFSSFDTNNFYMYNDGTLQLRYSNSLISSRAGGMSGAGTSILNIGTNGRVGVGLTNPNGALHVQGARTTNPTAVGVYMGSGTSDDRFYGVSICSNANSGSNLDFSNTTNNVEGRINYEFGTTNQMRFYTGGNAGGNIRMRILDNGNVGIGTTPTDKLNVDGDVGITGALSAGSKAFKISHPNPQYKDSHYLIHTSIESNTAGTCQYEYKVYVEDEYELQLPPYFKYLIDHTTIKAHITPIDNLIMCCYSVIDEDHIKIKTSAPSNVSVLVSGVRKDKDAISNWKGESILKPPPIVEEEETIEEETIEEETIEEETN